MKIDIRENSDKVEEIVFGDGNDSSDACTLFLSGIYSRIESPDGDSVYIASEEDAENLIKALRKAIEMGVWK